MKWMHFLLPVVVLIGVTYPAQAQLFTRKLRLNNMQVPELIVTARTDTDERKRVAAIEQLREHDAKAYPDIVPSLIEVMLRDPKYNVRMEAMYSLVKIRPMTQQVSQALQQTAAHDENWRVRMQTKTQVFLNGYNGGTGNANAYAPANAPTTNEPPLMSSGTVILSPTQPTFGPGTTSNYGDVSSSLGRRLPSSPPYNSAVPQQPTEAPMPVQVPSPPPQQIQIPPAPQQPIPQQPIPLPLPPTQQPPSIANDPVVIPVSPPR